MQIYISLSKETNTDNNIGPTRKNNNKKTLDYHYKKPSYMTHLILLIVILLIYFVSAHWSLIFDKYWNTSFYCDLYRPYIEYTLANLVQWLKLLLRKSEITGSNPSLAFKFQRDKMFLLCSLVKIQYCGKPLWTRGTELSLKPPGPGFLLLCLEGSVISPSSEVLRALFSLYVH